MAELLVYFLVALGVSFLCSLLEAGLLSVPASHIALLVNQNKEYGKVLSQQKQKIAEPLSAILTLNTIAHTVGAAGVGAQVAHIYGDKWVVLASIILTFLILFFSEIIPKTLGAVYCRGLSAFTAYTTKLLIILTYPLLAILKILSRGLPSVKHPMISRDEINALSHMAAEHGTLSNDEFAIIKNLLALKTIQTQHIMTPLSVVFSLPSNQNIAKVFKEHAALPFSRIPIFEHNSENLVGFVLRFKLLSAYRNNRDHEILANMTQPMRYIDKNLNCADLLSEFFKTQEHLLAVRDDKNTVGIVTLEDAIETLLGVEIVDETDTVVDMRELAQRLDKRRRRRLK